MLRKIKTHIFLVGILLVLSLLPFWWLRNGELILGHDAGTPISPSEHFVDRLEVWTYRYQGGSDQTFALPGFFIHGFEFLLDQLPVSVSVQQRIEFSIYFLLIGLSMYVAAQSIFPKIEHKYALAAAIIYEFNHFILQAWFIAERTKFSTYIALPLLAALLFKTFRKELHPIKSGLISAVLISVLNGGGFLPLYGSIILVLIIVSLSFLLFSKAFKSTFTTILTYIAAFGIAYMLLNAYWLIPYYFYIRTSFSLVVGEAGGMSGVINWVHSISENTSMINLLRFQGIPEWYANLEHPYANFYRSNPLLVIGSFTPFFIISYIVYKLKRTTSKTVLILLLVLLLSLVFMAGSHKPFGDFYLTLIKYVPGFIAFRTPYYKFAPAFYFAFSLIFAFALSVQIKKKQIASYVLFLVLSLYLAYQFPFFTVNFFQYTPNRTTKVTVPSYVEDYAAYIAKNPDKLIRTALFPGLNTNDFSSQYDWGYWSLAPLHSLLDRHQYLTPQSGSTLGSQLIEDFYIALHTGDERWPTIAKFLGIDSILITSDFSPFSIQNNDSRKSVEALASNKHLSLIREFGKWKLFKLDLNREISHNYIEVQGSGLIQGLSSLLYDALGVNQSTAITQTSVEGVNHVGTILPSKCRDCQLRREQKYFANPNIIFLPGSKVDFIGQILGKTYTQPSVPANSLQKLYIINALISRKQPEHLRLSIWSEYVEELQKYRAEIDGDLEQLPKSHQILQDKLSNVQLQVSMLKDISEFVNTAPEADLYLRSIFEIDLLEKYILQSAHISTDRNQYKLTAVVRDPGEYQVYVFNESINAFSSGRLATVLVGSTELSSLPASNSAWTRVGNSQLSVGEQRITISDDSTYIQVTNPQQAEIGGKKTCQTLHSQTFLPGLYTIDFSLLADTTDLDASVHILKKMQPAPILPYWGLTINLVQGVNKKLVIPFDIEETQYADISLCAHKLKSPAILSISSFSISRLTTPSLVLFKKGQEPITTESTLLINRNSNTANTYSATTPIVGIINTLHPFNTNWQVRNQSFQSLSINDSTQGIVIPPGSSIVEEEYNGASYTSPGRAISVLSLGLLTVLLILSSVRQYKK